MIHLQDLVVFYLMALKGMIKLMNPEYGVLYNVFLSGSLLVIVTSWFLRIRFVTVSLVLWVPGTFLSWWGTILPRPL